jgi:hypothetical protein
MPKMLTSRIWGTYFGIQSRLQFTENKGYRNSESLLFRLIPNLNPTQIAEKQTKNFDFSLHFGDTAYYQHDSSGAKSLSSKDGYPVLLDKISQTLGKKLIYLELNFDSGYLYGAGVEKIYAIDPTQLVNTQKASEISKKFGIRENTLINTLLSYPIIPANMLGRRINWELFSFWHSPLIKQAGLNGDLIVIGGELVWSRWLDEIMLFRLLSSLLKTDIDIHFDYAGTWQLLLSYLPKRPELLKLNDDSFQSDLSYIFQPQAVKKHRGFTELVVEKRKARKQLFLEPARSGMFQLESDGYSYQKRNLARNIYINLFPFPELEKFTDQSYEKWWHNPVLKILPEFRILNQEHVFNSETNNNLNILNVRLQKDFKKGSSVKFNEPLGLEQNVITDVIDLQNSHIEIKKHLKFSNGEYVKKGDILIRVPTLGGFWDKPVYAPVSGKLDYSYLDAGVILIKTQLREQEFYAPLAGEITGISRNKAVMFKGLTTNIPFSFTTGPDCSGILTEKILPGKKTDQILICDESEALRIGLKTILESRIKALLFSSADYYHFIKFLEARRDVLKHLSLGIFGEWGAGINPGVKKVIRHHMGSLVFIGEGLLRIPLINDKLSLAKPSNSVVTEQLLSIPKSKGEIIKFISYSTGVSYARMETIRDKTTILVVTDAQPEAITAENILSLNQI